MSKRLLVVSPDEGEAHYLCAVLGVSHGNTLVVDWACTLASALHKLAEGPPSMIVLDCDVPECTGIATFDAVRDAAPRTPILTLHDSEQDSFRLDTLQRGARGFLVKTSYDSYLLPQLVAALLAQEAAEAANAVHLARAEITLDSIDDAVMATGIDGRIEYMNESARRITGWPRNEAIGRPSGEVLRLMSKRSFEPIGSPLAAVLRRDVPLRLPPGTILIRHDGSEAAIEDSSAPIHDGTGRLAGAVIVFHDVTAAQAMVEQMTHLATHDFLTDLPNRAMLLDRIGQAVALARRDGGSVSLLYLDLDNFKHVNDSLGHPVGDRLLCSVADRLRACVRASDTVSRQGGDEFVILIPDTRCEGHAASTADKVLAELTEPHCIDHHELHITASIGISVYPDDGDDAIALIKNADTAMYIAKERGRNNRQFFEAGMNARAIERQLVESNLRLALERNEFVLYYQPKVNLATGAVIGAEALIRWHHPDWGVVPPDRFIRVAEDFGLIVPMGRWVLREACRQVRRWQQSGMAIDTIAVNVSAVEFRSPRFIECVRFILDSSGLAPDCLELEITESVLMHDAEGSRAILAQLKDMGIQLAVDDFGTGYSSLSYLKMFPIDVLKIDKSFVSGIGSAEDDGTIASAVIAMGNSLNYRVVAEGVEDQFQLDFLRSHNCQEGQGYYFSRPLAPASFEQLLAPRTTALAN